MTPAERRRATACMTDEHAFMHACLLAFKQAGRPEEERDTREGEGELATHA